VEEVAGRRENHTPKAIDWEEAVSDPMLDPAEVTPEQFAGLVANADDDQIAEVVRATGTEAVLDRIFEGMEQRFVPDKAKGVDAVVQFVITDEGAEHPYSVTIAGETCKVDKGQAESPKVTITTDIVSFSKLVVGRAQGPQLFMAGKLKVSGDLMFSARIMSFFDRPEAA
jgi:putative sterol carrier protein